eukprot:TRINITY_DN39780_c0_g1_i1.p1 TRINITY_DN39780_c0_g1~~TRINITY_DN39780_c0_g1_i1.p1  ORF type:complete len:1646 (-),score=248.85 TRINITY_DN39780_c0_g1_i1:346-5283(-)
MTVMAYKGVAGTWAGMLCVAATVAAMDRDKHGDKPGTMMIQMDGRGHLSRWGPSEVYTALTHKDESSLARFLITSTFGPTRAELDALSESTAEEWLSTQFSLPATSHRAYFRERVNPHANASCQEIYGERQLCAKGSRWVSHTFTVADVGRRFNLNSTGALFIDGELRTEISNSTNFTATCSDVLPPSKRRWGRCADKATNSYGSFFALCKTDDFVNNQYCQQSCFNVGAGYDGSPDCSGGWGQFLGTNLSGKVCSVVEPSGGPVMLTTSGRCDNYTLTKTMLNPRVWLASQDSYTTVTASFESSVALPGIQFLAEDSVDCGWLDFISSGQVIYRHDARMKLAKNTPGAVDASACAPRTLLSEASCIVVEKPSADACEIACGSADEVANDPLKGHQFAMRTAPFKTHRGCNDNVYDRRGQFSEGVVRPSVWLNIAMHGQDQLRQRMAWALSQIFVVGIGVAGRHSEPMFAYYDIFVRHAFGNFRSVMREVTFSPIMGAYLTFLGSKAYDQSLRWPDENYARELMQLFTIGLEELHLNGSKVVHENMTVPTYDNEHIMSFARVFTGFSYQSPRRNTECLAAGTPCLEVSYNRLDAMDIRSEVHDVYPKPDLKGGYLGDGYTWCSDLAHNLSISKGARYEFLGYSYRGTVLELTPSSGLYKALQAPFKATVVLAEDVACPDEACNPEGMDVVKVGEAFFEFVPPACVHPFFYNGRIAKLGNNFNVGKHNKCLDPSTALAGWSCCSGCEDTPPNVDDMCSDLTDRALKRKCGRSEWISDRICRQTCWDKNRSKEPDDCSVDHQSERSCSAGTSGFRYETAKQKCNALGLSICAAPPQGCDANPEMLVWSDEPCNARVTVHADGKVSDPDMPNPEANRFTVNWTGDVPEPGTYDSLVKGDMVLIGNASFRNPPVFIRRGPIKQSKRHARRAALHEVESLLDHLFFHANTPVFVSKKLIQRFVTSNPSAAYVTAVARAFKQGQYAGVTYSGKYGDLKATVAAILLHEEARKENPDGKVGLLREPFLKLVHLMRSLQYEDATSQELLVKEVGDLIGQAPYESPSVFNFYDAMYMPPKLAKRKMESPELEPEPEPEPESLVAPEFQVFTTPWTVRLHNGLTSLLQHGLSSCDSGFGLSFGAADDPCKMGNFKFGDVDTGLVDGAAVLKYLNLLLTGGRLTEESLNAVTQAFETSNQSITAASQAIAFTPEFNNLGNPLPEGPRQSQEVEASTNTTRQSYKATVLLYMGGGADTFHMLVPGECQLYEEYREVRAGLVWDQGELIKISAETQPACKTFGVHPKLDFLAELYKDGQASFVSNVGQLVEPLTRSSLKKGGGGRTCPNGFSHSDATANAMQMACGQTGSTIRGHGGRIADELAELGYKVAAFSVAGVSDWAQGDRTTPEMLDAKDGAVRYDKYHLWAHTIQNVTSQNFGNIYCNEYAVLMSESLKSSEKLGSYLDSVALSTDYAAETSISHQLRQVARVIKTREARGVERDFFHVKLSGFDTHRATDSVLMEKFAEINDAIRLFVTELKAQQVWESTVLFTESDFGRTLSFNGDGTDHGWGGNQFMIGGNLAGGKIHNDFLQTYRSDGDYISERGRVIPEYPWESMGVPIAEWNGITDEATLLRIFPNLGNFNRTHHIISHSAMFNV